MSLYKEKAHSIDLWRRHWDNDECDPEWLKTLNGFENTFHHDSTTTKVFAIDVPARICVFGDHSDYVPYISSNIITFASSEQRMRALIVPNKKESLIRIASSLQDCDDYEFQIEDVKVVGNDGGQTWLEALDSRTKPKAHWSNYVKGAVSYTIHERGKSIQNGFDMFIHSTIPAASGSSSSSALTLCGLVATHIANDISWTLQSLTEMGGKAEWYVGTRGGMMDHATMMFSKKDTMLKLQFRPFHALSIDGGGGKSDSCRWYSVFTHASDKGGSTRDAFNELVEVQQSVIARCLQGKEWVWDQWEKAANLLPEVEEIDGYGTVRVRDRFRFVMKEYERVRSFVSALDYADSDKIEETSKLFNESWQDTRTLLGTHTTEMEFIANRLREKNGVLGVKVLGAGFGGNLLVYARPDADLGPEAIEHTPGHGLRLLELN